MPVTSRQIMETVGMKNAKTLTRWYQSEVIPRPTIEKHPSGAGRTSYWDTWVLEHCQAVKELIRQGMKLREIAEIFGNDWPAIASRYTPRRYRFSDVTKKMDYQHELTAIREAIRDTIPHQLLTLYQWLLAPEFSTILTDVMNRTIDLSGDGYNPVLILSVDKLVVVVPDFLVGAYLAKNPIPLEPLIVIPLFGLLAEHFGTDGMPRVRPAPILHRKVGDETMVETYTLGDNWTHKVLSPLNDPEAPELKADA